MRIDQWLWVVRLFKSRSQATAACRSGRIRLNGAIAKASAHVAIGDTVTWKDPQRIRDITVLALIPRRVGAPEAATTYQDNSEPVPPKELTGALPQRDRGAGRPEKKDRRDLDRLRGFQK
jgi:ribosome-associated heat shock protein Hsp15